MTTYVLGAGASKHAGYPFAKSMGSGLFKWMANYSAPGYYDLRGTCVYLKKRFANTDDIEDLLTKIDELINAGEKSLANSEKPALVHAIREWFAEIRQLPCDAYGLFAQRVVQPGDAILTFNYDVSLDRQLKLAGKWEIGNGYGFTFERFPCASKVSLLKLHGSANWLTAVPISGARPLIGSIDLDFLGYHDAVDPLFPPSVAAVSPMILPTRCKKFYFDTSVGREWQGFWDSLWDAAAQSLVHSDRVVVCGYGLLPVDERACQLLLQKPTSAEVEVCCGNDTERIVQRFREHGRNAVSAKQVFFEDWVNSHIVAA